jgi:FKBP-type peptidyl-prolyl cis-trans isomerase 2
MCPSVLIASRNAYLCAPLKKKKNMSIAGKGDAVKVHYTGRLLNGTVFDSSEGRSPLGFTLGDGNMIKGFDAAVYGMAVGDQKSVTIPCVEAYGEKREDMMLDIPMNQVPPSIKPEIGMELSLQNQMGQPVPVKVVHVDDEKITLDANHQLAGEDLIFDITLVAIG